MHGKVFDLRLPLGYLFAVLGLLMVGQGLRDDPSSYARSLGINLNLMWGGALIVFAAICLWLAFRQRKAAERAAPRPKQRS